MESKVLYYAVKKLGVCLSSTVRYGKKFLPKRRAIIEYKFKLYRKVWKGQGTNDTSTQEIIV